MSTESSETVDQLRAMLEAQQLALGALEQLLASLDASPDARPTTIKLLRWGTNDIRGAISSFEAALESEKAR